MGNHLPYELAHSTIFRPGKRNNTILCDRSPETAMKFVNAGFVRVIKAMKHETVSQFAAAIVFPFSLAEGAGLCIALTLPRSEENILASPLFYHPSGDMPVFVGDAVVGQIDTMYVPLEMR